MHRARGSFQARAEVAPGHASVPSHYDNFAGKKVTDFGRRRPLFAVTTGLTAVRSVSRVSTLIAPRRAAPVVVAAARDREIASSGKTNIKVEEGMEKRATWANSMRKRERLKARRRRVINICFRSPPPAAVIRKRGSPRNELGSLMRTLRADWFYERAILAHASRNRARESERLDLYGFSVAPAPPPP
ncbi:hypothetical protein ALC62_06425 [Cyphomyrmex costatus]|uniref:Uncharacterized protein n=1 Tax=Cyphomyrmex costatus TaxID=456900 RepID=A0A195CPI9_9HYME|nr:hypothetical protein ALC62_06425 [Cyphomyrmex costatus]